MKIRALVLVLCLSLPACAPPVTVQTPAGKVAYTADQIAIRVGELQNAAISANRTGSLPDATTRLIVQFSVTAAQTLQATPVGWQTTVTVLWQQTKRQLPGKLDPTLTLAIATVDAVMASLYPVGVIR